MTGSPDIKPVEGFDVMNMLMTRNSPRSARFSAARRGRPEIRPHRWSSEDTRRGCRRSGDPLLAGSPASPAAGPRTAQPRPRLGWAQPCPHPNAARGRLSAGSGLRALIAPRPGPPTPPGRSARASPAGGVHRRRSRQSPAARSRPRCAGGVRAGRSARGPMRWRRTSRSISSRSDEFNRVRRSLLKRV
jgi:hypothetical protein